MTRTLLTAIFLTLFSQTAWATDAETIFKKYNDDGYIIAKMICYHPVFGTIITVTNDGTLSIDGAGLSSERNGNTLQFYSADSTLGFLFDFTEKVWITIDLVKDEQKKEQCYDYLD